MQMNRLLRSWRMIAGLAAILLAAGITFLVFNPPSGKYPGVMEPEQSYPYTNEDRLFVAIYDHDLASAKMLISQGVDVNFLPDYCESDRPLIRSVHEQYIPMIELLLDAGASNTSTDLDPGILYSVSRTKDEDILNLVLNRIHDINHGENPTLMWAIKNDWDYMIQALLNKGADPNLPFRHPGYSISDYKSGNALVYAIYKLDIDLIELLIGYGADVNALSKDGYTPLLIALHEKVSPEIICALIEAGADVNCPEPTDEVRNGHLHYDGYRGSRSGKYPLHFAAEIGDEDVCRALIEAGADIESLDWREATPLTYAAGSNSEAGVRLLLNAGANPTHATSANQSPLHMAAQRGTLENVILLVEYGADVNYHGESNIGCSANITPLGEACRGCKNVKVIDYLLKQGANPLIADDNGVTPLQYLLENPVEEGYNHNHYDHWDTCSYEQLTANREQIIELLQQYE